MPFVLDHISASSLKTFRRCPEQYRQRYVLGRKERPAVPLIWGTAHHKAIEHNFEHKITTYNDLPARELMERFAVALDERIDEDGGAAEIDWKDDGGNILGSSPLKAWAETKDQGTRLVKVWREVAAPRYQPTAVERQFRLEIPGFPPVEGRIDLETAIVQAPGTHRFEANGSDLCASCGESIEFEAQYVRERGLCAFCAADQLVDNKTSGKNAMPNDSRIQGWIYQLVRPLDYYVDLAVKTKTPQVVTGVHGVPLGPRDRTLGMVTRVLDQLKLYLEEYGEDMPWPDAIDRVGTCGYCGFGPKQANLCPWWRDDGWRPA